MRGTTFSPAEFNALIASVESLPESGVAGAEVLAVILTLLAANWEINWPPPHHDDGEPSSLLFTDPSTQQQEDL
jgi:hypothetical protein